MDRGVVIVAGTTIYVTAIERTTEGINKAEEACLAAVAAVGCLYLVGSFGYCGGFEHILQLPASWARRLPGSVTHDDDGSQQSDTDFG